MTTRIVDPVLNIFIGTSPAMVARVVARQIETFDATDRQRVATLMIDTMRVQPWNDGVRQQGSDVLQIQTPRFDFQGAWTDEQKHNMIITAKSDGNEFVHRPGIGSAGAGGIRNNAHVAMALSATNLEQRIKQKLAMIGAPSELRQDQQLSSTVRINIITFLGGGTGSGVMPALTLLTRYLSILTANKPQTAIYAVLPEHPLGLTKEMHRRQRSNAFATLIELMALLYCTRNAGNDFKFPLGALNLDLRELQVVDVVYLYGKGKLTSHTEIYEHIAMDLLLRMQDGHGAGQERKRQLPDISALNDTDSKGIPTRFATSGAVEIVFPRAAVIGAFARRALESILTDQTAQLTSFDDENKLVEELISIGNGKFKQELVALDNKYLGRVQLTARDNLESYEKTVEERLKNLERDLRTVEQPRLTQMVRDALDVRIKAYLSEIGSAEITREEYILTKLNQRIEEERTRQTAPAIRQIDTTILAQIRNPTLLDRVLNRRNEYVQRALKQINANATARAQNLLHTMRSEIWARLISQHETRLDVIRPYSRTSDTSEIRTSQSDAVIWKEARVPFGHRFYTRMVLPEAAMVERLWQYTLTELRWSTRIGAHLRLDSRKAFEDFLKYGEQRAQNLGETEQTMGIRRSMEKYLINQFTAVVETFSLIDIIQKTQGANWVELLRLHIRWALEHAKAHLDYNSFQEHGTNDRIARQIDIAMNTGQQRQTIQQILDEENTRAEIPFGLKLVESLDRDRISVLYSEYGISLRSVTGFHEESDSYVEDYILSQTNWMKTGILPPHASDLLTDLVATTNLHVPTVTSGQSTVPHDALPVDAMADAPRTQPLYPRESLAGTTTVSSNGSTGNATVAGTTTVSSNGSTGTTGSPSSI